MRRFLNADLLHGDISDSTSLNRYAYVNGNPVSFTDPFGLAKWWENALKIAAGVAVIASLAVVTVATAGTAAGIIAGAAAIGGAIGGTIGATTGYIENGAEGAANGFLVGSLSGAASGAVAAFGFSAVGVAASNVAIDVGSYMMEQTLNDEKITTDGVLVTAGASMLIGNLHVGLKNGPRVKWEIAPGWLNKAGDLYADKALVGQVVKRETRRANRKYAQKRILRATDNFNKAVSKRMLDHGVDLAIDGIVKSPAYEGFSWVCNSNQRK